MRMRSRNHGVDPLSDPVLSMVTRPREVEHHNGLRRHRIAHRQRAVLRPAGAAASAFPMIEVPVLASIGIEAADRIHSLGFQRDLPRALTGQISCSVSSLTT
jgi:hypothetical protein